MVFKIKIPLLVQCSHNAASPDGEALQPEGITMGIVFLF
jgi:hypothetical protein